SAAAMRPSASASAPASPPWSAPSIHRSSLEDDNPMTGSPRTEGNPQPPVAGDGSADPVAYMLAVMKDDEAEPTRRDGMAKAAAPYLRPKSQAGRADGRDALNLAVAGAKASLARKLARLAEALAVRDG